MTATAAALRRMQTEHRLIQAQRHDLSWQICRRELVEHTRLETAISALGHRVRDQVLIAAARHGPPLGAKHGIPGSLLTAALDRLLRDWLRQLAASRAS